MLLAMPAAGFTQGTQPKTPPAVPATATAAPQTPASAAADTPQTSPAAPGTAPAVSPAPTAAPANPSSPGKTLAMVNPETYVIGADDSLQVTVWKEPTLSGTFPVRPDGKISLVLVGDLPAAGKTPTQLGDEITLRLKKYVQDPVVTVVVIAVNSQRVFLVGEVPHVGPIMLTPGMTPLQAIAAAGGPTMFASVKKIYILRGVGGKQQKIPFNYKQALKGDNKQDVSLEPGDTIVVP
jgi:polysaccharide export outer membrane protein